MNPTIPPEQLSFNSAFENGNLDCAIKVGPAEYDLFLRIDSNSRGHTNWYHFSVKNKQNTRVKFNICNLKRRLGLYDQGFRPFVKSRKGQQQRGESWEQKGEEISVEPAPLRYQLLKGRGANFFRLSFSYTFEFEDDQIFFAYCAPYTYSNLREDIKQWEKSQYLKASVFGRSLSGLQLQLLHITNHKKKVTTAKKNVVITGRAHPAESSGSHVLKGFIQWLLGESREASEIRERTNFFIIPMLNPDGVIMGNSRTSAAGKDLNREFLSVRKDLYPQVYLTKTLIARLQKKHKVLVFLDFHGHSQRKNTFFYGPAYPISHREYYRCRAFPKIVQKMNQSFRFYSCSFQISEAKRSAARAVALTQLKVPYAYTVQSSVGLYYDPHLMKTFNFTRESWEQMGGNIAFGLSQFILGIQQLEQISFERKLQRQKSREGKFRQRERENDGQKRERKKFLLLDAIEEVKVAVSKGVFDQDVESDDHNSEEDLQPYQLSEFNNLVIVGKERQRKEERKVFEQEEQNFELAQIQQQEIEQVNPYQEPPKPLPIRNTRSVEPKVSWNKLPQTSLSKIRTRPVREESRSLTSNKSRDSSKNFIKKNRQRVSAANLNFVEENRCQIISLPKTPAVRRQKLGLSQRETKVLSQLSHRKGIHSIVDQFETKISKKHQNIMDASLYQSLHGLQLDHRAITVTTFRKK